MVRCELDAYSLERLSKCLCRLFCSDWMVGRMAPDLEEEEEMMAMC